MIRYDARGHGASQPSFAPADYQWSRLADDLLAVADSLKLTRFAWGALSMGFATSVMAALRAPDRAHALVLAMPPTASELRAAQAGVYQQPADCIAAQGLPPVIDLLRRKPIFPAWLLRQDPAVNEAFLQGLGAMDPKAAVTILRGAGWTGQIRDFHVEFATLGASYRASGQSG